MANFSTFWIAIVLSINTAMAGNKVDDNFSISGVIETEAAVGKNYEADYYSQAGVAKIEIAALSQVSQSIDATFVFQFENESSENGKLDKAFVTLKQIFPSFNLAVGRLYLYETFFSSDMVTDAITQELTELRMEGMSLQFHQQNTYVNFSLYKSPLASEFDHKAEFVVDFSHTIPIANQQLIVQGLYTSNIVDSQHLAELVDTPVSKHTPAIGFSLSLQSDRLSLMSQCVGVTETIDRNILTYNEQSAKPFACQLEASRSFNILQGTWLSLGYQWSEQAFSLGYPVNKWMMAAKWQPRSNLELALELARSQDYARDVGGAGSADNALTAQMAVEF